MIGAIPRLNERASQVLGLPEEGEWREREGGGVGCGNGGREVCSLCKLVEKHKFCCLERIVVVVKSVAST